MNKGNTTVPIYAIAGVQMSSITEEGSNRVDEVMPMLDLLKKGEGVVKLKQVKLFVKFTPSNNAGAVQILKSGEHGNLKEDTFTQIYPNDLNYSDIRNTINPNQ